MQRAGLQRTSLHFAPMIERLQSFYAEGLRNFTPVVLRGRHSRWAHSRLRPTCPSRSAARVSLSVPRARPRHQTLSRAAVHPPARTHDVTHPRNGHMYAERRKQSEWLNKPERGGRREVHLRSLAGRSGYCQFSRCRGDRVAARPGPLKEGLGRFESTFMGNSSSDQLVRWLAERLTAARYDPVLNTGDEWQRAGSKNGY
jgi:hypothetical protein